MVAPSRLHRAAPLLASLACLSAVASIGACFVDPRDDVATVRVTLDLERLEAPLADEPPGPRDADGLLDLSQIPAYLQIWVTGPGISTAVTASWPDESAEPPTAIVSLEIEVPAGSAREFRFLAYVYDEASVRAWRNAEPVVRDLPGGLTSDLAVSLEPIPTGRLRVELTGARADDVHRIVAVDGDPTAEVDQAPAVAFPPQTVSSGFTELSNIPIGRPISFRLILDSGLRVASPTAPVVLAEPNEARNVQVSIP